MMTDKRERFIKLIREDIGAWRFIQSALDNQLDRYRYGESCDTLTSKQLEKLEELI